MRQLTKIEHVLEIRDEPGLVFHPAQAGMYREAQYLAFIGHVEAALNKAQELRVKNYGSMGGVTFRVVTTTKTISVFGPWKSSGVI